MPTPIRVLAVGSVYPPHHLGGYEIIWRGVMGALRQAGHATRILTTTYRRADQADGVIEDPGVHRELDWYWHDHAWRRLSLAESVRLERGNAAVFKRHLEEFSPDVITWWPMGGMSLGLIEMGRRAKVPSLFFVLDPWLAYGPAHDLWLRWCDRLGPLARPLERLTGLPATVDFADAGRWVFCSQTMREQVRTIRPEVAPGVILSPGVEHSYLSAPESKPPEWGWRLLYLGRVVEQKGVRTAVEALAQLPEAAELRVVGDGDGAYRQELQAVAESLGVEGRVRFEPARSRRQVLEVYRAADAVVFPVQWAEPWGLVPLEAMAAGRPVIATGRGGSGEYLEHERNSLLFEAGDATALAAALRRLADDPDLRERLRRAGRQTAMRYSATEFNRLAVAEIEGEAALQQG